MEQNMDIKSLINKNSDLFKKAFSRTSLKDGLDDILNEALELSRYTDFNNLKEELGDLLCSVLARIEELGLDPVDLVNATHEKIENAGYTQPVINHGAALVVSHNASVLHY